MNSPYFSLKWNGYSSYMTGAFESLRYAENFVDVTLSCQGRTIRAHKIILSACSPFFKDVLKESTCQHSVIILINVRYTILLSLIQFMYRGEVSVPHDQLPQFLHTAEILDIRGLTGSKLDSRQPALATTPYIAQQLMTCETLLEQTVKNPTNDSLYRALVSNVASLHPQPLIEAMPNSTKQLVNPSSSEISTVATSTATVPVLIAQQQPTIANVRQVPRLPDSHWQTQPTATYTPMHKSPQQLTIQATTLQKVVDNAVQLSMFRTEGQQIITLQPESSLVSGSTVTKTTPGSSKESDNNTAHESGVYIITTQDTPYRQEHDVEQQTESVQTCDATEFICFGETTFPDPLEIVGEHIEDKHDADAMAQDNIAMDSSSEMGKTIHTFPKASETSTPEPNLNSAEKMHLCPECRYPFSSDNAMKRHRHSKHHAQSGSHMCDKCNSTFKTKWSLSSHKSRYHRQNRCIAIERDEPSAEGKSNPDKTLAQQQP